MDQEMTRIAKLAQQILDRTIDPVEAAVYAVGGRPAAEDLDDPDLMVLHRIETNADHIPWGRERQYWNKEVLAEIDASTAKWLEEIWPDVERACKNLVRRFGSDQGEGAGPAAQEGTA